MAEGEGANLLIVSIKFYCIAHIKIQLNLYTIRMSHEYSFRFVIGVAIVAIVVATAAVPLIAVSLFICFYFVRNHSPKNRTEKREENRMKLNEEATTTTSARFIKFLIYSFL